MHFKTTWKTICASLLSVGLFLSPSHVFGQESTSLYAPITSDPSEIYGEDFTIQTNDDGIRLENILGEDTRVPIQDTTEYPYSALCKFVIHFTGNDKVDRSFVGTGFFISDNQILTAGHCLYDKNYGGMASSIDIYPASDSDGRLPYGAVTVTQKNFHVTSKWINSHSMDQDFGLITLDTPMGQKPGILSLSHNAVENVHQQIMIAGYPYQAGDRLTTLTPKKGYGIFDSYNANNNRIIYHNVDTQPGQSGSPILNANNEVIGIHTFGMTNNQMNGGTMIDDYVLQTIQDWTRESTSSTLPEYPSENDKRVPTIETPVYRVYNPTSTEHFYTPSLTEAKHLIATDWKDEGVAWNNEKAETGTPLYRVFNPVAGDHHYTLSKNEVQELVKVGWNDEGIAWYSSSNEEDLPVYRLYNPNAKTGTHHFTYSYDECVQMMKDGWKYEGIAFYTR